MSDTIIFTLFEGFHEYGVGSLINSAIKCGFKGKVVIGYRGPLPFWINQLDNFSNSYYLKTEKEKIEIIFKKIEGKNHLRYYKPSMFESLFHEFPKSKVFYFDPDITLIGDWWYFEQWVDYGVACILDENYPLMPSSHPIKQKWAELLDYSIDSNNPFNYYINSGFLGCQIRDLNLIQEWNNHILTLQEKGGNLLNFNPVFEKTSTFKRLNSFMGDQDILNATINKNNLGYKLSIIGPEGMGFIPAGYLMYHNTGKKTWNKNVLKEFLLYGNRISQADQSFLENSSYPINLYSRTKLLKLKLTFLITKIIQRVL
ncbi:hypothetical protein PBAC_28260 [Pedobacter glucosidilyticus]|nr:hypothetical protein [Pedobacter glucosidilyticus]KHJ36981.1 hypothetical protein PBAC_28260 [Pedobacter glucosidilyticus]